MSVEIRSDSNEAKALEHLLTRHIGQMGLEDDPESVAQYITLMMCNNRPANEITAELSELFGAKFDHSFTEWVFNEAQKISNGDLSSVNAAEPVTANIPDGQVPRQSDMSMNVEEDFQNVSNPLPLSSRFDTFKFKGSRFGNRQGGAAGGARNGISKGGFNNVAGNATSNRIRGAMLEQSQQMGNEHAFGGNSGQPEGHKQPLPNRCRHWPFCDYPNCKFFHPRKKCWAYPNCTNAPGTCSYLHPGQDYPEDGDASDASQYFAVQRGPPAKTVYQGVQNPGLYLHQQQYQNQQQQQQQQQQQHHHQQPQPQIEVCRFSDKCANKTCHFGHPTPANTEARVQTFEWCENKEQCSDPSCVKAHPSGSLVREPAPLPGKTLETCKFLDRCTNPKCRFRHPLSRVRCRNGADCDRLDCLFTHPFKEPCKFGINCRNYDCLYEHPAERDEALKTNKSMTWTNQQQQQPQQQGHPSERQFAEDQVMEQIIPGQDQQQQQV